MNLLRPFLTSALHRPVRTLTSLSSIAAKSTTSSFSRPHPLLRAQTQSIQHLSTSRAKMSPQSKPYLEATKDRRTYYQLESTCPIPDSEIVKLAEHAILNVPSAFNNQSTRMTVLLKAEHKKLWEIVSDALIKKIGQERWEASTKQRIMGFKAAYGSVLFVSLVFQKPPTSLCVDTQSIFTVSTTNSRINPHNSHSGTTPGT